ncbi:MAG: hypothetical protein HY070_09975 [Chloroflexi bacterium]|nr:hypothetical protein [Chloroflexota bacterium]
MLIGRVGYLITEYYLSDAGACPKCGEKIPGIWHSSRADVRIGAPELWWTRAPREA